MKKKDKICIVAVEYNRPESTERQLYNLAAADYSGDSVDLLISIDKGERQDEIVHISEQFQWMHGEKNIRVFPTKQGLRPHIIQCGDISEQYAAVVVLEDDVTVSPVFYQYVKEAIRFYMNDERIAGISLHKRFVNDCCNFFEPECNGYDTFLMQYAQSWGECWTSKMWRNFKQWYEENQDEKFLLETHRIFRQIPCSIRNWGNQSWLKFFMAYIVDKDLYFVYPYQALSTNHSEKGEHNSSSSNAYQVSMLSGKKNYCFASFENAVKYDIFMERMDYIVTGYENQKVVLDLYGTKEDFSNADVLISSQQLPYKLLESWELKYRPHEVNCKYPVSGHGLYVYDLKCSGKKPRKNTVTVRTRYDVRASSCRNLLKLVLFEIKTRYLYRIKKLLRKQIQNDKK